MFYMLEMNKMMHQTFKCSYCTISGCPTVQSLIPIRVINVYDYMYVYLLTPLMCL